MRGIRSKRLRKLGLKSGPSPRPERPRTPGLTGWERAVALPPNEARQARAEAKRARRRARNRARRPYGEEEF